MFIIVDGRFDKMGGMAAWNPLTSYAVLELRMNGKQVVGKKKKTSSLRVDSFLFLFSVTASHDGDGLETGGETRQQRAQKHKPSRKETMHQQAGQQTTASSCRHGKMMEHKWRHG